MGIGIGIFPDLFGLRLELKLENQLNRGIFFEKNQLNRSFFGKSIAEWDLNARERAGIGFWGIGALPFSLGMGMGMGLPPTKRLEWESLIPISIRSPTPLKQTCPK